MKRALVFDIDNTLTPPRRPLNLNVARILIGLTLPFHVAAGSDLTLVQSQFLKPLHKFGFRGMFDAFLCNGATRYRCVYQNDVHIDVVRNFDFRKHLGESGYDYLLSKLDRALKEEEFQLPSPMEITGQQVVFRHSMVNLAPIGRPEGALTKKEYANRDAFILFDQRTGYRRRMLEYLNKKLSKLREEKNLFISLGGQTSFDIVIEGNDKSYALNTLLSEGFEELTYIGDALFEGGNDEAIIEYISKWNKDTPCPVKAVLVNSWKETIAHLKEMNLVNAKKGESISD